MSSTGHFCSVAKSCLTLSNLMQHARLPYSSFTISRSLLKFMSLSRWFYLTISSSAALFSFSLQSLPTSESFPMSSLCIRWSKYWHFSFSISPSNEYSGLISFRIDWFDLPVQGTLKSLLQHHNLKVSVLWHSALFMVQLSYLYITTAKTIALTIRTFVSKVTSLVYNTLSRFTIALLPRSKRLLISWLKSPSTVIWELMKIKSVTASTFAPSIWHEVMSCHGTGCHDLSFFQCWISSQLFHSLLSPTLRG